MKRVGTGTVLAAAGVGFLLGWFASNHPRDSLKINPQSSPDNLAPVSTKQPGGSDAQLAEIVRLRSAVSGLKAANTGLSQELTNALQQATHASNPSEYGALIQEGAPLMIDRAALTDRGVSSPGDAALTWLWASISANEAKIIELESPSLGLLLLGVVSAEVIKLRDPDEEGRFRIHLKLKMDTGKMESIHMDLRKRE